MQNIIEELRQSSMVIISLVKGLNHYEDLYAVYAYVMTVEGPRLRLLTPDTTRLLVNNIRPTRAAVKKHLSLPSYMYYDMKLRRFYFIGSKYQDNVMHVLSYLDGYIPKGVPVFAQYSNHSYQSIRLTRTSDNV